MTRFRTIVKGQNPDGSWMDPVDLRCVGGPADGKWFSEPPEGYERWEIRGGAVWVKHRARFHELEARLERERLSMIEKAQGYQWCGTCANGGIVATYPHALPDEHP